MTVQEWTAILRLADTWNFRSIRALAINRLTPIATNIDKIVLGREFGVDQWLGSAYLAVCMRDQSLTKEEARRMQLDDIIEINDIRQHFGLGACYKADITLSMEEVVKRFGLMKLASPSPTNLFMDSTDVCLDSTIPAHLAPQMQETMGVPAVIDTRRSRAALDGNVNLTPLPSQGKSPVLAPLENALDFEERAKEMAKVERVQRTKDIKARESALKAFQTSPAFERLNIWGREKVVESLMLENIKLEILDFMAGYQAET